MEGVYSRAEYIGKERKLRKHKRSIRKVWRTNECRSKEIRKNRDGGGKKIQEEKITEEVYSKDAV